MNRKNYEEVIELIHFIKEKTNKKIYLWTGYLKENVEKWINVKLIDYLIDGKFDFDKKDLRLKLRSSSNQRIFKNRFELIDKNTVDFKYWKI